MTGMAYLGVNSLRLARRAYAYLYLEPNLAARYGGGSWVMIAGSANGLGLGFAERLAAQGFNICFVSDDQEALTQVETLASDVQVKTMKADLGSITNYDKVWKQMAGSDISMVINCAISENFGKFHFFTPQEIVD
jgi:short-subunit dehydrogenase